MTSQKRDQASTAFPTHSHPARRLEMGRVDVGRVHIDGADVRIDAATPPVVPPPLPPPAWWISYDPSPKARRNLAVLGAAVMAVGGIAGISGAIVGAGGWIPSFYIATTGFGLVGLSLVWPRIREIGMREYEHQRRVLLRPFALRVESDLGSATQPQTMEALASRYGLPTGIVSEALALLVGEDRVEEHLDEQHGRVLYGPTRSGVPANSSAQDRL